MGKIKAHGITLNGSQPFDAGSKVQGHVFVHLDQPLKVRGIRILFRGSAEVKWSETEVEYDSIQQAVSSKTVTYRSTEDYLSTSILLHGVRPSRGNITTEMSPGRHKFPFTFTLPSTLPASFEGEYGHVRYYAESNIDLPWKFDPKSKRTFTVRPLVDLNKNPRNRLGLSGENDKNLCCLCCKSGPISATFRIEKQGFVPGESIKLFAEINNDSDRAIDGTYVELKRIYNFYAEGESKTQTMKIAKLGKPAIRPHGKDAWNGYPLKVPATPPSGFPGCRIIDVKYELKLRVDPAGPSLDLEIPFRINIGTIPLRRQQRRKPSAPPRNVKKSPVNPAAQTSYSSMEPSCHPTAPPTYDESASAPPCENEQAPPNDKELATAPPEDDKPGSANPIKKAPPNDEELATAPPEDDKPGSANPIKKASPNDEELATAPPEDDKPGSANPIKKASPNDEELATAPLEDDKPGSANPIKKAPPNDEELATAPPEDDKPGSANPIKKAPPNDEEQATAPPKDDKPGGKKPIKKGGYERFY